jgi:hypothetical protein
MRVIITFKIKDKKKKRIKFKNLFFKKKTLKIFFDLKILKKNKILIIKRNFYFFIKRKIKNQQYLNLKKFFLNKNNSNKYLNKK